jgi:hypothetical protein
MRRSAASGLKATLLSLGQVSLGTPMVTCSTGFPKVEKYLRLLACMTTDLIPIWVWETPLVTYIQKCKVVFVGYDKLTPCLTERGRTP